MTKNFQFTRPNVESEINFNQNPELNPGALINFASVAENVGATGDWNKLIKCSHSDRTHSC